MADLPEELLGKQVYSWKISDVIIWITHIKFKQYASNFKSNGIDGTELYELEETDVDGRLGITKKVRNCEKRSDELGIWQFRLKYGCSSSSSLDVDITITATQS